ncbi:uncharacterized protein LOC131589345 [Poecile atricapillus]|uniref:uncharacterized protein LOC131589345 n=1 Tax=Poecile atricapillus TaxID=48891 RepID=UPI002739D679|nr:uncharacterized protein LOC131589345 [Poecile atricapillus]
MGQGALLGQKGLRPPQDYEICLGGGGSPSGVPKPARCPGRLPAPARPTRATARNTQKAAVYCSPGVPGQSGGSFTAGAPPPHQAPLRISGAKTLLCCILPAFLPLKTWIWGAQPRPATAAPRESPGRMEWGGRGLRERCHLSPHLGVPTGATILWGLQELLEPHTPRPAEGKQESEQGCAGRRLLLAREQREREGQEASWPPCHPSVP